MLIPPALAQSVPDARLIFLVSIVTVVVVALFAAGAIYLLLRRGYERRLEEQKMAAVGTATARILHQIKNPLQTILLHVDLLQDRVISSTEEARREICGAIIGEANRLTAMLAELSVYAGGFQRKMSLEPYPLHDLVEQLARNAERGGAARVEVGTIGEAMVLADGYYLRQALDNLISNAFDALEGREDALLRIRVAPRGDLVEVAVADNGPGITPERLETIFQPFLSEKTKGMGLGLAISKEIVEGHGGRIEVQSRPGTGTTFFVLLPRQPALRAAGSHGGTS